MVDRWRLHRSQYLVENIGRAGYLQEMNSWHITIEHFRISLDFAERPAGKHTGQIDISFVHSASQGWRRSRAEYKMI